MKLLHAEKEPICRNCIPHEFSVLEMIEIADGKKINLIKENASILFVLEGSLSFSMGKYKRDLLHAHQAILIPPNYCFKGMCVEKSQFINVHITEQFFTHECFLLERTQRSHKDMDNELHCLSLNRILQNFLVLLKEVVEEGLSCKCLLESMVSELFLILSTFYSTENLAYFFRSCINQDMQFSQQVYKLYPKYTNMRQLAEAMNYSYSGFIKRFKRVFNKPPYAWIKGQKTHQVYHEIISSNKNFNEISHELGFSSAVRFTQFCKSEFGMTPLQIRNKKKW